MTRRPQLTIVSRAVRKQDDPADRLRALIDTFEPQIQRAFLDAIADARASISLDELANLIEQGRLDDAFAVLNSIPNLMSTIVVSTIVSSGVDTADFINSEIRAREGTDSPINQPDAAQTAEGRLITVTVRFDQTNDRAVAIMRNTTLRLIREFTQEQRNATQLALVEGIARGANPREQARIFRDSIGLTTRQQQAVSNYRRLLENNSTEALRRELRDRRFDSTVSRAIRTSEPLSDEQIGRMVGRYQERYLRFRSEVIARTEALRAVHQGTEEMYQQAFDNGALNPQDVFRTWVTARDARVRDSHNGMNGQERPPGEAFVSDDGNLLRYPGDESAPASETIQCRCVLTTRFT